MYNDACTTSVFAKRPALGKYKYFVQRNIYSSSWREVAAVTYLFTFCALVSCKCDHHCNLLPQLIKKPTDNTCTRQGPRKYPSDFCSSESNHDLIVLKTQAYDVADRLFTLVGSVNQVRVPFHLHLNSFFRPPTLSYFQHPQLQTTWAGSWLEARHTIIHNSMSIELLHTSAVRTESSFQAG